MASIAKRPDGTWRARYRDAERREHSKHFSRKIDAQNWLDTVTTSVQTGSYVDPKAGKVTVASLAEAWLAGKVSLAPSSRERAAVALRVHVIPRWGTVRASEVTHSAVQAWVALLSRTLSPATVQKTTNVLSQVLDLAVRERRLASNPCVGLSLPRVPLSSRRYLTAAEVERLASEAGRHELVVLTLAYCGLRWGEMSALQVRHLDPLRRRLLIERASSEVKGSLTVGPPKAGARRTVPLPGFLADALGASVAGRSPEDLLFPGAQGAMLRRSAAYKGWWGSAVRRAGLEPLSPHELRHTAASLAVSSGASVLLVQRMLGHASAAMTLDVYADLFDEDLDQVGDALGEVRSRAAADFLRTNGAQSAVSPLPGPSKVAAG